MNDTVTEVLVCGCPNQGLGHLISCILINGAQYFKRISESGIKKMCRNIFVLQQNLTNITMSREADLDFARYSHLLHFFFFGWVSEQGG